jgi:hypothetical protein
MPATRCALGTLAWPWATTLPILVLATVTASESQPAKVGQHLI